MQPTKLPKKQKNLINKAWKKEKRLPSKLNDLKMKYTILALLLTALNLQEGYAQPGKLSIVQQKSATVSVPSDFFDSLLVDQVKYNEALVRIETLKRDSSRLANELAAKEVRFVRQIGYTKSWEQQYQSEKRSRLIGDSINERQAVLLAKAQKPPKRFMVGLAGGYGAQIPSFRTGIIAGLVLTYKIFSF